MWPDDLVTLGLGLSEGIENALSLARVFQPVWACVDAGNLELFPNLRGIESISVAVDNDPEGLRSYAALRSRWSGEIRAVRTPSDLNDWLREAA